MTTIPIFIGLQKSCSYYDGCALIKSSDLKALNCKSHLNSGFKYVTYIIISFVHCSLKFFITNGEKNCNKNLKLSKNGNGKQETIKCKGGHIQVYVYFYGEDPRPLLLCYNNEAFVPKDKSSYVSEWKKVPGIGKCVCSDKDECDKCDKLIKELVKVVGLLNTVDLSKHPNSNGKECTSSSTAGTYSTCTTSENGANTCTYVVQKYNSQEIKVKVDCSDVSGKEPTNGNTCYRKLTHVPAGMCEDSGQGDSVQSSTNGVNSGFRLGDVTYPNGKGQTFKVPYYSDKGLENGTDANGGNLINFWHQPLVKVTAYFYDLDTNYNDPLLVELQFKNGTGTNDKEYYKLTERNGSSMTWTKDKEACKLVKKNGKCLVEYLDKLRYDLKKVLKVDISQKDGKYTAMWRSGKSGAGTEFKQLNGEKKVDVKVCESTCPKLAGHNYKCFQHKLTGLGEELYKIGGVAFTIPGQGGKDIVISLFDSTAADTCTNGQNGQFIEKLMYNKCMGDVYVFFYAFGADSIKPDTVPLMLWYDKNYYRPCSRESYFTRWEKVSGVDGQTPPCGSGEVDVLAAQLDEVNKALNRIDLDNSKVSTLGQSTGTGSYGLPEEVGDRRIKPDPLKFPTDRVSLKKQEGPSQPPPPTTTTGNHAYYRVVHRTVNGFQIGEIRYNGQEIVDKGVNINGGSGAVTIDVKNGGHKKLVESQKWNTVVAYYSKTDIGFKLPQLIVILSTKEVSESEPVQGSAGTGYGYYILSTKNGSGSSNNVSKDYEYVWHLVKNGQSVTLDDATDFRLLNSIVILLEHRPKNNGATECYKEEQIKDAISKAKLKSPGLSDGINRITGKKIYVTDEIKAASTSSTISCLKDTGFKLFTHDISELVTLDGQLGKVLKTVKLIAGLRFLIPCKDNSKYMELSLSEGSNGSGRHYLYHKTGKPKVCGYFYGQDPRPLMLCYDGNAYRPKDMLYYFSEWVRETSITFCGCIDPSIISDNPFLRPLLPIFLFADILVESALSTLGVPEHQRGPISNAIRNAEELVKVLVQVSNFLNPVKLYETGRNYVIQRFNGQTIRIQVEKKQATETFCYNKYTHTHCGTGNCKNGGKGFRLGNIKYDTDCIKESSSGKNGTCITSQLVNERAPIDKYKSADKVVVFYYKHDTSHNFPMVVAMGKTNGDGTTMCNLYYVLKDKVNKVYKKETQDEAFDLDDNAKVTQILDKALFSNNNRLQIILDQRPIAKLYCPPKPPESAQINGKKVENKEYKHPFQCEEKENGKLSTPGKPGSPSNDKFIPASYKAQLYESTSSQAPNGSTAPNTATTTNAKTEVKVSQVDCPELSKYGYRCYEHKVVEVENVDQIGGLKFYLWDNREGVCG